MNSNEEFRYPKGKSQISYGALFGVLFFTALLFGLITNASKIKDAIWLMGRENAESVIIPYLPVKLHNSGNDPISLPLRGLCFLWPPEYSWDFECGYEFKQTDGTDINTDAILVPAKGEKDYLIHVTKLAPIHQTKTSLARFFSAGDWQIQFTTFTDQNGRMLIHSSRIPFTADAMSSGYLFEVYRETDGRLYQDEN